MQTQTVKAGTNATYNFASYLLSLYIKPDEKCTHTRLKDVELGVKGGAYIIFDSELEEFYKKYYQHVFVEGKQEYLTEIQLHDAGPILVDFDFKYDVGVEERQHTKDHVVDMVLLYMNTIKKILKIESGVDIPVFVFEKTTVNCKTDMTKDGIHMIIGIHMERKQQMYLRSQVLLELKNIWKDLPVINSWEDVIDNSITSGKTGWQLYNSRKPGCKVYLLKYHFILTLNESLQWEFAENQASEFNFENDFKLLTARYKGHKSFQLNEEYKQKIEEMCMFKTKITKATNSAPLGAPVSIIAEEQDFDEQQCAAVIARLNPERARDFANWNLVYLAIMNNREMSSGMKGRLVHQFSALCPEKYDESEVEKHIASWRQDSYSNEGLHFASVRMRANEDSPLIPKGVCLLEMSGSSAAVPADAEKAWIDMHTKVSDSHNNKSWSETLFKIYNKYGNNNIGRKLAHYFSMKDVSYNAEKVDYFWNKIKPENIDKCVFGLTRLELNESLNQMFRNYQTELIQLTKDRNKKEKKQEKRDASEDEEYQGESTVDAVIVSNATDETVAIEAFELIKKDFIYSRGQYFFKKDNLWNNNVETFKSALRSAVLNLKVLYPKKIETDSGEKTIYVKYCTFVSKLNAVVTLVKDSVTLTNDDSFYDKLHTSVKGKLVFKDGVYDFAKKEFFVWGCEHLLKNPVYSVSCCPHNFPTEDSVSQELKDKCIDTIYGAFTKTQQTNLLHFLARAVAGHIEDKNFAQQLMNRDSGKGVQCEWIMYALGALYVGSVDYANFIVQQNTSDDSAKANGWLMPFQFKRLMLTNESKGDIADKKIKLDGGKIKSICSGGDAIEARALFQNSVNIHIQSTLMILCNDTLPCTTPDVFEKCLQISGQSQFKSQEFIDEKMAEAENRPELQELYKRQYRLEDDTIKDVVKKTEWSAAFIRIMIDNYQTKRVHITKIENNGDDENEMSLNENILENYTVGSADDFISNEVLKVIDAPQFKVSLKKLKQGIFYCFQNAKEGKRTVGDKRLKGICGIKYIVDNIEEVEECILGGGTIL